MSTASNNLTARVVESHQPLLPPPSSSTSAPVYMLASLLNNIATCHHKLGRYETALQIYEASVKTRMEAQRQRTMLVCGAGPQFDESSSSSSSSLAALKVQQALQEEAMLQLEVIASTAAAATRNSSVVSTSARREGGAAGRGEWSFQERHCYFQLFRDTKDPDNDDTMTDAAFFADEPRSLLYHHDHNDTTNVDHNDIDNPSSCGRSCSQECSAITLYNLGLVHIEMNKPNDATTFFQLAVEVGGPDPSVAAMSLNCMAQIHILAHKQPQQAIPLLTQALYIMDQVRLVTAAATATATHDDGTTNHHSDYYLNVSGDVHHACVVKSLTWMSRAHYVLGNSVEALNLCSAALSHLRASTNYASDSSLQVAVMVYNMGLIYHSLGNELEAEQHIAFFLARLPSSIMLHPKWTLPVAWACQLCGSILVLGYNHHGRRSASSTRAIGYLNRSLELCNKHLGGTTHPMQLAETLTSLGMAYFKSGNFDDALSHLLSAHKIPLQWSGGCCVSIRCYIGHVYYAKGDLDRAIPYYEDALNLASIITMDHYHVTKGMLDLFTVIGSCLWEQGNCDDAVSYISEAIQIRDELISLGEFSEDDDGSSSRSTGAHHLTDLDMILEMMEWFPVSAAA